MEEGSGEKPCLKCLEHWNATVNVDEGKNATCNALQPISVRVLLMTGSEYIHYNIKNYSSAWPIMLKIWKGNLQDLKKRWHSSKTLLSKVNSQIFPHAARKVWDSDYKSPFQFLNTYSIYSLEARKTEIFWSKHAHVLQVHGLLGFEGTKAVLDYPPYHLQKKNHAWYVFWPIRTPLNHSDHVMSIPRHSALCTTWLRMLVGSK